MHTARGPGREGQVLSNRGPIPSPSPLGCLCSSEPLSPQPLFSLSKLSPLGFCDAASLVLITFQSSDGFLPGYISFFWLLSVGISKLLSSNFPFSVVFLLGITGFQPPSLTPTTSVCGPDFSYALQSWVSEGGNLHITHGLACGPLAHMSDSPRHRKVKKCLTDLHRERTSLLDSAVSTGGSTETPA